MNPAVTEFIDNIKQPWQIEISKSLRQLVNEAIPDVEERIQYSKPHFLKNGKYAAVLGTAKGWVSFTIFNATSLEAPAGFFEEGPAERKTIKILEGKPVDYALLAKLVAQAASTI